MMDSKIKQAVEAVIKWEVGKQYPLDLGMTGQQKLNASNLRAAFEDGLRSVLNNPSKYGLQPTNEWVSVKDMPPENSGLYFVYDGKDVGIARMSVLAFRTLTSNEVYRDVTHYQTITKPLPPQPDVEPK